MKNYSGLLFLLIGSFSLSGCASFKIPEQMERYAWTGSAIEFKHKNIFLEPMENKVINLFGYGWIAGWSVDSDSNLLWGFTVPDKISKKAKYELEGWIQPKNMTIIPGQRGQIQFGLSWNSVEKKIFRMQNSQSLECIISESDGIWTIQGKEISPQPIISKDGKTIYLSWNIYQPGFLGGDPHGIVALNENGVKWIVQPPRSREPIISWNLTNEILFIKQPGLIFIESSVSTNQKILRKN